MRRDSVKHKLKSNIPGLEKESCDYCQAWKNKRKGQFGKRRIEMCANRLDSYDLHSRGTATQRQWHGEEVQRSKIIASVSSFVWSSARVSNCQMDPKGKNENQPIEEDKQLISYSQNRLEKSTNGSERAIGRYSEKSVYCYILGKLSGNSR